MLTSLSLSAFASRRSDSRITAVHELPALKHFGHDVGMLVVSNTIAWTEWSEGLQEFIPILSQLIGVMKQCVGRPQQFETGELDV